MSGLVCQVYVDSTVTGIVCVGTGLSVYGGNTVIGGLSQVG